LAKSKKIAIKLTILTKFYNLW